jgi:putative membrane protein
MQFVRGFAMGSADIVPGVSGGTVALVLGIYERLIAQIRLGASALRHAISRDLSGATSTVRRIDWMWLGSLLVGILAAIAVLSAVIERLLDEQPVRTAAVFSGLVLGSVVVAWNLIRSRANSHVLVAAVVAVGLFALLGLRSDTHASGAEVVTQSWWVFTAAGALAICAMILPGISGSFILVMIGMYTEVLGAVNDRDLLVIAATGLGCVIGLASFSTLLDWLLRHHHDVVIAAMVGLMLGSMRVLWPWPAGTDTTRIEMPTGDIGVPLLLALVAFVLVIGVDRVARRRPATD